MVTDLLRRLQANTCPEAWSHLGQPKAILIHEATCPTQPQATTLDRLRSIHAYHLWGGLPSLSVRLWTIGRIRMCSLMMVIRNAFQFIVQAHQAQWVRPGWNYTLDPTLVTPTNPHPPHPPPPFPLSMQLLCKVMYGWVTVMLVLTHSVVLSQCYCGSKRPISAYSHIDNIVNIWSVVPPILNLDCIYQCQYICQIMPG